jgi:transposase
LFCFHSRFRDEKKLCTYAGLVPSTYASGGKVFHGRITKTGNKWLRRAFIEVVQPAISCDGDLFAYYQGLKMKKGANAAAPSFLYAANILLTWRSDRPNTSDASLGGDPAYLYPVQHH